VRLLELSLQGLGDPPGSQRSAHAFERGHHLEPLDDVLETQ
jgi:hypothetical protein